MSKDNSTVSGGVGFGGLLLLLFITLMLLGIIDWSWWWVLSQMWLPIVVISIGFLVCLAIIQIGRLFKFVLNL